MLKYLIILTQDVKGHIVEFSMDQQGSRFIQTALDASSLEERRTVFEEIHPQHTLELISDVYGNYVSCHVGCVIKG